MVVDIYVFGRHCTHCEVMMDGRSLRAVKSESDLLAQFSA
jgi:hypothetical protein